MERRGGDRVTFIAEQDGRWIGLATGLAADPDGSETSGPMLVGMFVEGAARRRGVGAALVESIAGWARARGAIQLALWVTSGNEAGIALYRRCGFRLTGAKRIAARDPALAELELLRDLK